VVSGVCDFFVICATVTKVDAVVPVVVAVAAAGAMLLNAPPSTVVDDGLDGAESKLLGCRSQRLTET